MGRGETPTPTVPRSVALARTVPWDGGDDGGEGENKKVIFGGVRVKLSRLLRVGDAGAEPDPSPWPPPAEGERGWEGGSGSVPAPPAPFPLRGGRPRAGAASRSISHFFGGVPKVFPTSWRGREMLTPPLHPASTAASRIHAHPWVSLGVMRDQGLRKRSSACCKTVL